MLVGPIAEQLPPEVREAAASMVVYRNPPDHTRLRRLVNAAFTHRRVQQLTPRVQQIADALLDGLDGEHEVDLIARYAYPLPMTVICELLGVPEPDRDDFQRWTSTTMAGTFAGVEAVVEAYIAIDHYLRALLKQKRAAPADDLVSGLVSVRDGGDKLSETELVGMV